MENSATLNLLDAPQCCGINLNLDASGELYWVVQYISPSLKCHRAIFLIAFLLIAQVLTATAIISNMELVSQFTEDAIAKEDRICGRPACGSIILKGAPYHYIATIVPSQPGRFVCRACYLRYAQKLSTSVRPSSVRPSCKYT
jgi:hypothetical protein